MRSAPHYTPWRDPALAIPPPPRYKPYSTAGAVRELGSRFVLMKFILLDRITALEPGKRIVPDKALSLAEEYLADHFPTFPVMPGVLMLEALVQSASWLVRATTDFSHSIVVLAEARNVTYKSFVSPGRRLTL